MKRIRRILIWLICILMISLVLGIIDCWLAGTPLHRALFSLPVWKLSDGGTTGYIGLGYSITYYQEMGGVHGPVIRYWFFPFAIYYASENKEIRWISASAPKEPTYHGRKLSGWVSVYSKGYSGRSAHATLEEAASAEEAIRAMGTNTLPCLVAWLSEDGSDTGQYSTVLQVFQILGEEGRPAVPALAGLTTNNNNKVREYALQCLFAVNPDKDILVSTLRSLLKDPDKSIRYDAAQHLGDVDAEAAKRAGVFDVYPELNVYLETNKSNVK